MAVILKYGPLAGVVVLRSPPRHSSLCLGTRCGHNVIELADTADDDSAAMDADAEADRLAQIMAEELIQFVDIGGNHRRGLKCLAAGGLRAAVESEQRQLPVADKLVGLTAAFDHSLRHRAEETVDDEHGIERQPIFREPG